MSKLSCSHRVDLRTFAKVESGVLYVRRLTIKKVWVPLGNLASSARVTATQMLSFLGQLTSGRSRQLMSVRAAEIIITQFQHDLVEMCVVRDFIAVKDDGCMSDTLTVEEYAARVFHSEVLPIEMSFLRMAMDLLDQDNLYKQLTIAVQSQLTVVPCTTVHVRAAHFCTSTFTLLTARPLSTSDRLICVAMPLVGDYFPDTSSPEKKLLLQS